MDLINCTPHAITLHAEGDPVVLPPSGHVARLVGPPTKPPTTIEVGCHAIRVATPPSFDGVEGLPPDDGVSIIVSAMVGACAPTLLPSWKGRVYGPDTGADCIRNEKGHVVGVRGLILYW